MLFLLTAHLDRFSGFRQNQSELISKMKLFLLTFLAYIRDITFSDLVD